MKSALWHRLDITFFGLVLGLSLPFWLLGAVTKAYAEHLPIQLPISALMCVCPGLAALILTYCDAGKPAVSQLIKRIGDFQQVRPIWFYLPIILIIPIGVGLAYVLNHSGFESTPVLALTVFAGIFWLSAASEELGWAAYSSDRLLEIWGLLPTAFGLGSFWAIWHIIPYLQADRDLGWIFWQCLVTLALRMLMLWFYVSAGRSTFAMIVMHMLINLSVFGLPSYGSSYDPRATALVFGMLVGLLYWRWPAKKLIIESAKSN